MTRNEVARTPVSLFVVTLTFLSAIFTLTSCASSMQPQVRTIPAAPPAAASRAAVSQPADLASDHETVPQTSPVSDAVDDAEQIESIAEAVEPEAVEPIHGDDTSAVDEDAAPAPHDELDNSPPEVSDEQVARERELAREQAPEFDIPMVVNDRVTAWVDFYSGPHREKFAASLARSGKYVPMFRQAFEEAGIPQDLVYMAHVESAFKARAYSRAKAKGIFQFISATGRRYGLKADAYVDERSDPEKSAHAAAAYLKDLYGMFGDWYLALAAYNAGEGKVGRGLATTRAEDFWTLARTNRLRAETKNYVPAILAATLIAKDPAAYGFDVVPDPPLAYDITEVNGSYDLAVLAKKTGIPLDDLKDLNPHLRRWRTPPRTSTLKVPLNQGAAVAAMLGEIPESARIESVEHLVQRGDTLGRIAGRYRVSIGTIQAANKMGRSTVIHPGSTLVIPTSGEWVPDDSEVASARRRAVPGGTYRVRSGDTLSSVARRHGTTPGAIAAASGISMNATLKVGAKLRLPGGKTAHRASAAQVASTKHQVRRGETLTTIASRYRTSVARLCELNGMRSSEVLVPGRMLTIQTN